MNKIFKCKLGEFRLIQVKNAYIMTSKGKTIGMYLNQRLK